MPLLHSSSNRPYSTTDAKVQAVLPQLTVIRMVALSKQLSRNRKQAYLQQGTCDADLRAYEHYVARETKLAVDRHNYYSRPYRKSLSHVKGVKLCLQRRRTDLYLEDQVPGNFGIYEGLSVKSLKNEIDKLMTDYNYDAVKMRQAKRLLADGKADGRIMNVKLCVPKLDAILNRPSLPRRRETVLGFESPAPAEEAPAADPTRRPANKLHLPPVTATRLNSPSKILRPRADMALERANTVA